MFLLLRGTAAQPLQRAAQQHALFPPRHARNLPFSAAKRIVQLCLKAAAGGEIGKIKRQRRQPGILLCRSEDFLRSAAAEMKVVPHCAQKSADIRQHLYAAHGGVAFAPAHGCARVKHKYRTDTFKKQFPHPRPPIFCPVFPYLLKTPHDGKRPSAAEPCTAACGAAFPRQARGWSPQARRLRLPPA